MVTRLGSTLFLTATLLVGQDRCPLPPSPLSAQPNAFSPKQEMILGDLMAKQFQSHFAVVKDDELTKPLNEMGQRMLRALPPSPIQFQFILIDLPVVNAFGIPGGRIYVTRKMIAFLQDDQELAGMLAHEIGHIYTHQQAIEVSRVFQDVLNVRTF